MEITITVDSMIDLITNSSTEIYTFPSGDAEKLIKKMVDGILKEAGTEKKFDDLFEIQSVPSQYAEDEFSSWIWDNKAEELGYDRILNPINFDELMKEKPELKAKYWAEYVKTRDDCDRRCEELVIKSKSGAPVEIMKVVSQIFDTEAIYNG